MCVDHIRRLHQPPSREMIPELRHVGQQRVLGQDGGGSGGDMLDSDSGAYPDPIGQSRIVATGVDGHVVAALT
jgi:hypothetical protein